MEGKFTGTGHRTKQTHGQQLNPQAELIKMISPEWMGFNWLLPQCHNYVRNRFPVIKPSVSASIRDIIGYLHESELVKEI